MKNQKNPKRLERRSVGDRLMFSEWKGGDPTHLRRRRSKEGGEAQTKLGGFRWHHC